MLISISEVDESIDQALADTDKDLLYIILGGTIDGLCDVLLEKIRIIILNSVYIMYMKNSQEKRGVG